MQPNTSRMLSRFILEKQNCLKKTIRAHFASAGYLAVGEPRGAGPAIRGGGAALGEHRRGGVRGPHEGPRPRARVSFSSSLEWGDLEFIKCLSVERFKS